MNKLVENHSIAGGRSLGGVSINAIGDIGLSGNIAKGIEKNGTRFPFEKCASVLGNADIVFGNLELPFSSGDDSKYLSYESKYTRVNPNTVECLLHARVNLVSLANNHIMDCGPSGVVDTMSILDSVGIRHAGAGMNLEEARKPVIVKANGIRVGFLAHAMKGRHTASENAPGASPIDKENMLHDIKKLKSIVDVLIVSLHFGMIYTDYPTSEQTALCSSLINAGVTVVLGHHPHVLQGVELVDGGLVAYSLGEFIFDPTMGNVYANVAREKRKESIILKVFITHGKVVQYEMTAVKVNNDLQPCIAEGSDKSLILERMNELTVPILEKTLNDEYVYKKAGSDLIYYQLQVYFYHLKKLNFSYIFQQFCRIRWCHIKLLTGFMKGKLSKGSH